VLYAGKHDLGLSACQFHLPDGRVARADEMID
jgi:hypothetical protein